MEYSAGYSSYKVNRVVARFSLPQAEIDHYSVPWLCYNLHVPNPNLIPYTLAPSFRGLRQADLHPTLAPGPIYLFQKTESVPITLQPRDTSQTSQAGSLSDPAPRSILAIAIRDPCGLTNYQHTRHLPSCVTRSLRA